MKTIEFFLSILQTIPSAIWGVLIGAFISFIGVTLTNRSSDRRLEKQFENDRKAKTKEREMDLRKEIFLETSVILATGVNTLLKFSNLDLTDSEAIKDYVEKSPAMVKLNLIANIDTISAVANFNTELSALFLKFYSKRAELTDDRALILFWQKEQLKNETEKSNVLETMKQLNIEGNTEARKWEILQQNYDYAEKGRLHSIDKINEISQELKPKKINLIRECMSDIESLASFQLKILKSVRNELELNFDESQFTDILTEAIRKNKIALNTYLKLE